MRRPRDDPFRRAAIVRSRRPGIALMHRLGKPARSPGRPRTRHGPRASARPRALGVAQIQRPGSRLDADTSGPTHQRQSETGLIGRSRLLVLTRKRRAALKPTTSASRGQGGGASSEWRVNCACDEPYRNPSEPGDQNQPAARGGFSLQNSVAASASSATSRMMPSSGGGPRETTAFSLQQPSSSCGARPSAITSLLAASIPTLRCRRPFFPGSYPSWRSRSICFMSR